MKISSRCMLILFLFFFFSITLIQGANAASKKKTVSHSSSMDAKAQDLLSQMTLEEKVGQMVQFSHWGQKETEDKIRAAAEQGKIGSLLNVTGAKQTNEFQKIAVEKSRLHVPILFGLDVIHGYKTIFPIPLAEDCAWNPELLEKCASVSAHEAYAAGLRWTFAPMVDVSREPRWGRISEGSGEDPTLGSYLAAARVRGFQGKHLNDPGSIVACAKHYVGYGATEAGREYNTTDMSEVTLREVSSAPVQGRSGSGCRHPHECLQRLVGRSRLGQPAYHPGNPQGRMGILGLRGFRLGLGQRTGGTRLCRG